MSNFLDKYKGRDVPAGRRRQYHRDHGGHPAGHDDVCHYGDAGGACAGRDGPAATDRFSADRQRTIATGETKRDGDRTILTAYIDKDKLENRLAEAQEMLALIYYHGDGVKRDYENSHYWFSQAASQGEPYSQFWLGRMYERGLGVRRDLDQAMRWYGKAAERGIPEAQHALGVCLCTHGDPAMKEQGLFWLKKAADQGHAEARHRLALYRRKHI